MIVNINRKVTVKLKEMGKKVLLNYYDVSIRIWGVPESLQKQLDAGVYSAELWHIMQIFGPSISMGHNDLFENDISIEIPETIPTLSSS